LAAEAESQRITALAAQEAARLNAEAAEVERKRLIEEQRHKERLHREEEEQAANQQHQQSLERMKALEKLAR